MLWQAKYRQNLQSFLSSATKETEASDVSFEPEDGVVSNLYTSFDEVDDPAETSDKPTCLSSDHSSESDTYESNDVDKSYEEGGDPANICNPASGLDEHGRASRVLPFAEGRFEIRKRVHTRQRR